MKAGLSSSDIAWTRIVSGLKLSGALEWKSAKGIEIDPVPDVKLTNFFNFYEVIDQVRNCKIEDVYNNPNEKYFYFINPVGNSLYLFHQFKSGKVHRFCQAFHIHRKTCGKHFR